MMPRDKYIFIAQGAIAAYVLYQVTTTVYQHLKSKDRLKCNDHYSSLLLHSSKIIFFVLVIKLLYKDNVE